MNQKIYSLIKKLVIIVAIISAIVRLFHWTANKLSKESEEIFGLKIGTSVIIKKNYKGHIETNYADNADDIEQILSLSDKECLVLTNVQSYEYKNYGFYFISDDGYCAIYMDWDDNLCRVYLAVPDDELPYGKTEMPEIEYLSSYDHFTKQEQKVFNKMIRQIGGK